MLPFPKLVLFEGISICYIGEKKYCIRQNIRKLLSAMFIFFRCLSILSITWRYLSRRFGGPYLQVFAVQSKLSMSSVNRRSSHLSRQPKLMIKINHQLWGQMLLSDPANYGCTKNWLGIKSVQLGCTQIKCNYMFGMKHSEVYYRRTRYFLTSEEISCLLAHHSKC